MSLFNSVVRYTTKYQQEVTKKIETALGGAQEYISNLKDFDIDLNELVRTELVTIPKKSHDFYEMSPI